MEASIQEPNIRQFIRILQCASKFGDELCMHASRTSWELAVSNSSKTAYCNFKLEPSFFCRYKALGTTAQQRQGVKCSLLVKSVLNVIGKTTSITNVKRIDLKIVDPDQKLSRSKSRRSRQYTEDEDTAEEEEEEEEEDEEGDVGGLTAKLEMKLVCDHGVIKRHSLNLSHAPFLRVEVDPASTPSGFTVETGQLKAWLDHFVQPTITGAGGNGQHNGTKAENTLGWLFSDKEVRVKTWEGGAGSRELSTEIRLDSRDFQNYEVYEGRVDLTLPMREFRSTLALADQLGIDLTVSFSQATQPLTLVSILVGAEDKDICTIFCAIATTACEAFADARIDNPRAQGNGNSHLNRNDSTRSRSTSTKRDDSNIPNSNGKRAASSIPPGSRSNRPSLSFTPVPQVEKIASVVYNSQATPGRGSGPSQSGEPEALFLPGGSQGASGSQRVQMSQAEALALAGFAGDDTEDLLDAMDDAGVDELEGDDGSNDHVVTGQLGNENGGMEVELSVEEHVNGDNQDPKQGGDRTTFEPQPGIFGQDVGGGEEVTTMGDGEEDELVSDSEEYPATMLGTNRQFTRLFND